LPPTLLAVCCCDVAGAAVAVTLRVLSLQWTLRVLSLLWTLRVLLLLVLQILQPTVSDQQLILLKLCMSVTAYAWLGK